MNCCRDAIIIAVLKLSRLPSTVLPTHLSATLRRKPVCGRVALRKMPSRPTTHPPRIQHRDDGSGVRQGATTVSLGEVDRNWDSRWGHFMFAERGQVLNEEFWANQCQNVAVCVQCTNRETFFRYPRSAAISQKVRVDPRDEAGRQAQLDQAMGPILRALEGGKDVLFHCNQSFHRAPVIGAAVCARMTEVSATAHMMKSKVGLRCF